MKKKMFRAKLRQMLAEIDVIRAGYVEPSESAAQRQAESAAWQKEMAESRARIDAMLNRIEEMNRKAW